MYKPLGGGTVEVPNWRKPSYPPVATISGLMSPSGDGPKEEKLASWLKMLSACSCPAVSMVTSAVGLAAMNDFSAWPELSEIITTGPYQYEPSCKPVGVARVELSAIYRMTPAAPAAAALMDFKSNEQVPRWIRATLPFSEPAGSPEHKRPLSPRVVTSATWAVNPGDEQQPRVTGSEPKYPSLLLAGMPCRLDGAFDAFTVTLLPNACEFSVAPTAITEGAVAGEMIELK